MNWFSLLIRTILMIIVSIESKQISYFIFRYVNRHMISLIGHWSDVFVFNDHYIRILFSEKVNGSK